MSYRSSLAGFLFSGGVARSEPKEIVSLRDDHTRVFAVTNTLEEVDPVTGEKRFTEFTSRYFIKGGGICYKEGNQWLVADPHWVSENGTFHVAKAAYGLQAGPALSAGVKLIREGESISLNPVRLEIQSKAEERSVIPADGTVRGSVDPSDPTCLVFHGAFGKGIDLRFRVEPSGFHQEIIFSRKPSLPQGAEPTQSSVRVYTALAFEGKTASELTAGFAGRNEPLGRPGQSTASDKWLPLDICEAKSGLPKVSFFASLVTDASGACRCAKRWLCTDEECSLFLVEDLPYTFFEKTSLPVLWDYHEVGGTISSDEVWAAGETYWVISPIYLGYCTLRIEGGATVKFDSTVTSGITAASGASIVAEGEPYGYVVFTSADDNTCGQEVPTQNPGPATQYLVISGSGAAHSRVRFCKFTQATGYGGMLRVEDSLEEPIEHNIFLLKYSGVLPEYCGLWYNGTNCRVANDIRNNLFVDDASTSYYESGIFIDITQYGYTTATFANNTFAGFSGTSAYPIYYRDGTACHYGLWTANIFANCYYATNISYVYSLRYNAYYLTYDMYETEKYIWASDPFDSGPRGSFYLKESYRVPGIESAEQARLFEYTVKGYPEDHDRAPAQPWAKASYRYVFTVKPPETYSGESVIEGELTSSYTDPSAYVTVGYHSLRIDRNVTASASVPELTIQSGAVLSFSTNAYILLNGGSGDLTLKGGGFWVHVIDSRVASSVVGPQGSRFVESPPPFNGSLRGQLIVVGGTSQQVSAAEVRFMSLYMGIWGHALANICKIHVEDCEFWGCTEGIKADGNGEALTLTNVLFYRNGVGCEYYYPTTAESPGIVENCTFDGNHRGIHTKSNQSSVLVIRNSLFTEHDAHYTVTQEHSFAVRVGGSVTLKEHYNAFFANEYDIIDTSSPPQTIAINERSYPLGATPYDRTATERSLWWIKGRESMVQPAPAEIGLEDAGSKSASSVGFQTGETLQHRSSNRFGVRDSSLVDIGYHPLLFFESKEKPQPDEMPDRWEIYYVGDTGMSEADDDDHDGVVAVTEYARGTSPKTPDTDGDEYFCRALEAYVGDDAEAPRHDGLQEFGFPEGYTRFDLCRGPYLQDMRVDPQTGNVSVTIIWGFDLKNDELDGDLEDTWRIDHVTEQDISEDALWVRRSDQSSFQEMTGVEHVPDPHLVDPEVVGRRCRLENLEPNKLYFYKIEFKENEPDPQKRNVHAFTPVYWFRTWPASWPGNWRFAVYGSSRWLFEVGLHYCHEHQEVADALMTNEGLENLNFIVHTGNLVAYGIYRALYNFQWNYEFFYPAAKVIRHVPVIPAPGYYDHYDDDQLQCFRYFFDFPGEGDVPPCNYKVTLLDTIFLLLDSRIDGAIDDQSKEWLFGELSNSPSGSRQFVIYSWPGYTHAAECHFTDREPTNIRDKLFPGLSQNPRPDFLDDPAYGVTAIFNGAVCGLYERAEIDGRTQQGGELNPVNQLILAGAGPDLDDPLVESDDPEVEPLPLDHYYHELDPEVDEDPSKATKWSQAVRRAAEAVRNYGVVEVQQSQVVLRVMRRIAPDTFEEADRRVVTRRKE